MIKIEDIKAIQKQFNEVIEYSQDVSEPCTDDLFKRWAEAKKRFIDKWGGLTYELDRDIILDRDEEEKKIVFEEYVSDISIFSSERKAVKDFLALQGMEGFYQNKVINKFDKDGIKINAGAKLSKSLKFFFNDEEKCLLDKFQTRLSRAIQDCKITGRMVMSVHPLDYLSSSETAHNWHSCHALDGEYRCGNLSYMVDNHTFIIYIKADKDYKLPNFPESVKWNSKKWRVLMYMNDNEELLVSGRQYPFISDFAFNIASNELIGKFYNVVDNAWEDVTDIRYSIMSDGIGSLQYNDCLSSPSYKPIGCMTAEIRQAIENGEGYEQMFIGEAVPCLECGGMNVSITSDVRCNECGDYYYCDHCGETCSSSDLYDLEGEMVCECCFDDNGVFCDGCGETFNEFRTEMFWDEETCGYYCDCCYDSLIEQRMDVKEVYEVEL